jgi:preprotein translocase subunit SecD
VSKKNASSREAVKRQTIAERKAAELAGSGVGAGSDSKRSTDEGKNS